MWGCIQQVWPGTVQDTAGDMQHEEATTALAKGASASQRNHELYLYMYIYICIYVHVAFRCSDAYELNLV